MIPYPSSRALDPRTFLCTRMNGEYLPQDHGAPLRLLVPGTYGLKNVKWIESVDISTKGHGGLLAKARLVE